HERPASQGESRGRPWLSLPQALAQHRRGSRSRPQRTTSTSVMGPSARACIAARAGRRQPQIRLAARPALPAYQGAQPASLVRAEPEHVAAVVLAARPQTIEHNDITWLNPLIAVDPLPRRARSERTRWIDIGHDAIIETVGQQRHLGPGLRLGLTA